MKFKCTMCGNCCRQSGALRFLPEDIKRISAYLGISFDYFCERYNITNIQEKLYFIETTDDCLFLTKDNKCSINEVKPWFCSNYIPFVDNPGSPIYEMCEGIGQGREWTEAEVKQHYEDMIEKFVIVKDGDA